MGAGTNPCDYLVAMFHATVYMLVLCMEKGILERAVWVGWVKIVLYGDDNIKFELSEMFK